MPSISELDVLRCDVRRRMMPIGNERRKYARVYLRYTPELRREIDAKFFPVDERKLMKKLVPDTAAAMMKMDNITVDPANFKWSSNVDNDEIFPQVGFVIKGLTNYDVFVRVGYLGEEP